MLFQTVHFLIIEKEMYHPLLRSNSNLINKELINRGSG